jgi:hypothetical protein
MRENERDFWVGVWQKKNINWYYSNWVETKFESNSVNLSMESDKFELARAVFFFFF